MNVVARQSIKYTIIGYFGFLLGMFSTLVVFPNDWEFYGKLRFVMTSAELIVPFVVLGISYSNVKFFYHCHKVGKHHSMLSWSVGIVFINFCIFLIGFVLATSIFPQLKTYEIWKYKVYVIPLILILSISAVFNKFITNYKRIAVANIFENLFPKIANLLAFCLFFFLGVSQRISLVVFVFIFVLTLLGYILYANRLERVRIDFSKDFFNENKVWKQFGSYSFFAFLGTFGNNLIINNYMIGELLGMRELGYYSTFTGLISLISIPQLGVFNISAPFINEALAEKKYEELDQFYKKTSFTLYFLGIILFSCLIIGFPYLASLIKNGTVLVYYQPVIWIWGSAVLLDLATGFNGNILSLSKYYKFNIVVMLLLAVLTIGLNYYFAIYTELKLIGIAISTAISVSLYNGIKVIFNYTKFKVSPFTIEMILATVICTLAITFAMILPESHYAIVNLIYKPLVVLGLIFVGNHFLKLFPIKNFLNKSFLKSLTKLK